MGGKKATSQRIGQFRSDAGLLSKTVQLNEMAKRMGLKDATYLGRCISGDKDPGSKFLDKFYTALGPDLAAIMANKPSIDPMPEQESLKTEEPPQTYGKIDYQHYIQTLENNNLDLRTNLGIVIKNNEVLVLNNQELVSLITRRDQPNK
jgi:hypothetical protein